MEINAHPNRGATPLLNDEQQALLWQALQQKPADGGLWTGPKVANWMSELLGRAIAPQRGWEYLRGLEYVRRRPCEGLSAEFSSAVHKPHPEHSESDQAEQQRWKKNWRRPLDEFKQKIQPQP